MAFLLEAFPGYMPEPGVAVVNEELVGGNRRSKMASIWLLNNYMGSIVYGMPRAAMDISAARQQLPLDRIGAALLNARRKQHA